MGKNFLTIYTNFLIDDSSDSEQDISTDLVPGTLDGFGEAGEEIMMHGENEDVYYLVGRKDGSITAQFHMNDTATTGAYNVLTGIYGGGAKTLTIELGAGAAPTTGDPIWTGEYVLTQLTPQINSGKWVLAATFRPADSTWGGWDTKS